MANRHLFYVESETNPDENDSTIVAHIISADSESEAKAEELVRASLLDECLPEGSFINSCRYLGRCERDTLVAIGELAQ